jgi:hypothetical protein
VRAAVGVVAVLVVLAGAVFAGQGLWIGSAMVVVGLALGGAVFLGRPRRQA